jgi:hypothetical protein
MAVSMSIDSTGPNELIATRPSAPASAASRAAPAMSWPCGLSLTSTGTSSAAFAARTAPIIGSGSSPM